MTRPVSTQEEPSAACANCGTPLRGHYCHDCGQRSIPGRLTVRYLLEELFSRFLNLERGVLRTLRDSLTSPGGVVRRYLGGQRQSYTNPITYLALGVATALVIGTLAHDDEVLANEISSSASAGLSKLLSDEQVETFIDLQIRFSRQTAVFLLLMCLPFAILMRLFFPGGRLNLAEATVFALFAFGTAYFLSLPTSLAYKLTGNLNLEIGLTILILASVIGATAWGYFDHRLWATLRAVLAFVLAYIGFTLTLGVGMLAYVYLLT